MEMGMDLFGNQLNNEIILQNTLFLFFVLKKKAEVEYNVLKWADPLSHEGFVHS